MSQCMNQDCTTKQVLMNNQCNGCHHQYPNKANKIRKSNPYLYFMKAEEAILRSHCISNKASGPII